MFRKLVDKAQLSYYRSVARKSGLICPSCATISRMVPESADQAVTCSACGTKAALHEWAPKEDQPLPGNPDMPPPGTKIVRETSEPGTTLWRIPASGKSGGLMVFATLWCLFVGAISFVFLAGILFGKGSSKAVPLLIIIPFLGIFWAIGIGMLYAGIRSKYARHQLTINGSVVTLRRELFGRTKDITLPVANITSVSEVEFYQKNYQPVHGIEIRGPEGKIRFGSMLTAAEKAWLVADLRRSLRPAEMAAAAVGAPVIAAVRQSYFTFTIPSSVKGMLFSNILVTIIGLAFVTIGIFVIDSGSGSSKSDIIGRIFDGANVGFKVIWTAFSSLFAVGGLIGTIWTLRNRGRETRLEGNDSEIAIRTYRHGLVIKERSFPRTNVTDFRTSSSGSSNGKPRKRIEMIVGNKSEPLARWADGDEADAFAAEARSALGQIPR